MEYKKTKIGFLTLLLLLIVPMLAVATSNEPYADYVGNYKGAMHTSFYWDDPNHYYNDQSQLLYYHLLWSDYEETSFQNYEIETSNIMSSAFASPSMDRVVVSNNLKGESYDDIWVIAKEIGDDLITINYDEDVYGYEVQNTNFAVTHGYNLHTQIFLFDVDDDGTDELIVFEDDTDEMITLEYDEDAYGYYTEGKVHDLGDYGVNIGAVSDGDMDMQYINGYIYYTVEDGDWHLFKINPASNTISEVWEVDNGNFSRTTYVSKPRITTLNGIDLFIHATGTSVAYDESRILHLSDYDGWIPHSTLIEDDQNGYEFYPMNLDGDSTFEVVFHTEGHKGVVDCDSMTTCTVIDNEGYDIDTFDGTPFSADVDEDDDGDEVCFMHNSDADKFGIKCFDELGNVEMDTYIQDETGQLNRSLTDEYDHCTNLPIFKTFAYTDTSYTGIGAGGYPHNVYLTPHFSFRVTPSGAFTQNQSIYNDDWTGGSCPTVFFPSWINVDNDFPDLFAMNSANFYSLLNSAQSQVSSNLPTLEFVTLLNEDDTSLHNRACINTSFQFRVEVDDSDDFDGYKVRISDNQSYVSEQFNYNYSDSPTFTNDFFKYTPDKQHTYLQSEGYKQFCLQFRGSSYPYEQSNIWCKTYYLYNESQCADPVVVVQFGESPEFLGYTKTPKNPIANNVNTTFTFLINDSDGGNYGIKFFPDYTSYVHTIYNGTANVGESLDSQIKYKYVANDDEIKLYWAIAEIYRSSALNLDPTSQLYKNNAYIQDSINSLIAIDSVSIGDVLNNNVQLGELGTWLDTNTYVQLVPIVVCGNESSCYDQTPNVNGSDGGDVIIVPPSITTGSVADSLDNLWDDLNLTDTSSRTLFGFIFVIGMVLIVSFAGVRAGMNGGALAGIGAITGLITMIIGVYLGLIHFGFLLLILGAGAIYLGVKSKFTGGGE